MKRVLGIVLSLCLLTGTFPNVYGEENKIADNVAIFSATMGMQGFSSVKFGTNSSGKTVSRNGKTGWIIEKSMATAQKYIYFDFEDEFAHEVSDGSTFDVEIEYYSSDNGFFEFRYDSVYGDVAMGEVTEVGNDQVWKTLKITLDDAYFGGRMENGADFWITASTSKQQVTRVFPSSDIIIGDVRITKNTARNPVVLSADIEEAGNTFAWYEEKVIHNTFKNTKKTDVTVDVEFIGTDSTGYIVSDRKEIPIKAGETVSQDFAINTDRCGVYDYEVRIKSADGSINSVYNPFEFVVLKTDPNGIKNYDHYYNTHVVDMTSNYTEQDVKDLMGVLVKTNAGGVRENHFSRRNMRAWGSFVVPEQDKIMYDALRANNMKILAYVNPYNVLYIENSKSKIIYDYCDNPAWIEGTNAWLDWILAEYGDLVDTYEFLNEPNADVWRGEISSDMMAKNYTSWAKIIYPKIKQHDPTAEFIVGSLAHSDSDITRTWVEDILKEGIADYSDGLSWHPYVHWTPYEMDNEDKSAEVYRSLWEKYTGEKIELVDTESGDTLADWSKPDFETIGDYQVRKNSYQKIKDIARMSVSYIFENCGPRPSDREDQFGLAGPVSSEIISHNAARCVPTAAIVKLTAMDYWLGLSEYNKCAQPDDNTYIAEYDSEKFGGKVNVMWAVNGTKTVTLETGATELNYSDSWGNEEKLASADGRYTFTLTGSPIYIQGNTRDIKVSETTDFSFEKEEISTVVGDRADIVVAANVQTDGVKVSAEVPHLFKEEEVQESFSDGKATLKYNLEPEIINYSYIRVKAEKDGGICMIYDLPVKIGDEIASSVSRSSASKNDYNRWKLDFDISNNYMSKAMKGKLIIKSPENFAGTPVDIGIIPRGSTARISVNIPAIYEKKIYNIDYCIQVDGGGTHDFSQALDFTLATKTKSDITVDGRISQGEWNTDTLMVANTSDRVKLIPDWSGADDLSVKMMMQWDDENMYLFYRVNDNIFCQKNTDSSKLWDGDSIQFGIFKDERAFIISGQGTSDFNEITIGMKPDGTAVAYKQKDQYGNADMTGEIKDCEIAIVRDDKTATTDYEFAIPWESLFGEEKNFKSGDLIGFSALVNDDDGSGRRGWIEYASGIGQSKNTDLFTYLLLLD